MKHDVFYASHAMLCIKNLRSALCQFRFMGKSRVETVHLKIGC